MPDPHRIGRTVRRYIEESELSDMRAYGTGILRQFDRFLYLMQEECRRLRLTSNDTVLDIGCGYGWHAVALHMMSGATVVANDIRPIMIEAIDAGLQRLGVSGVRTLLGDVCQLEIAPASYQAVSCRQTLEHVHDEDRMLDVIARVLAPGGRYIITNDNNALCRRTVAENTAMWARRDTEWAIIEEFRKVRPTEGAGDEPFAVTRERIVREAASTLVDADVKRIVDATAGLRRPEIEDIAKRYTPGATLPTRPPHSWCRNPETGEYCERLIDPFEVVAKLERRGLTARVRHGFTKWPLRLLNDLGVRRINTILFQHRPYFEICGARSHE